MEITTLCIVIASLGLVPNRSQFFMYESIMLSCGNPGTSSDWTVMRNTDKSINQECNVTWGRKNEGLTGCVIDDVLPLDTGAYWCEFGAGKCSEAVNITVTSGSVILETPVLPVQEGEAVTLRCINRKTSSSSLMADFYKDGLLIGTSSTGNMTIHGVLRSDEGLYKCKIFGSESRESWLAVREAGRPETHSLSHILLPVVVVSLLPASVVLLFLCRRYKGKIDPDVSYTDIIITQRAQPQSGREMNATVYSAIKRGAT